MKIYLVFRKSDNSVRLFDTKEAAMDAVGECFSNPLGYPMAHVPYSRLVDVLEVEATSVMYEKLGAEPSYEEPYDKSAQVPFMRITEEVKMTTPKRSLVRMAMRRFVVPRALVEDQINDKGCDRASGDVVCELCGLPYYDHPTVQDHEYLNVTCDWKVVKL